VAEELAARRINAVGAAAEIDLIQVELEDLILAELLLEGQRKHRLADLAVERAAVVEEDVAGELLGDRRATLPPMSALDPHPDRTDDTERVDADVAAEAAVLDRDHRVLHHLGYGVVGHPAPVARPQRDELGAVAGADHDHLSDLAGLQRPIARQRASRDRDRDDEDHRSEQGEGPAPDQCPP
jgi:hypothetical protein